MTEGPDPSEVAAACRAYLAAYHDDRADLSVLGGMMLHLRTTLREPRSAEPAATEVRDNRGYFEGFEPRECGEHRTVGTYRAWCHDCAEWCYPSSPCARCELPMVRTQLGSHMQ